MIYNKFQDIQLSSIGLGCMRLPTSGNYATIDLDATKQMVAYAMANGINYYDTAWGYHEGNSEIAMGQVLKDYPRQSFYLASKFPGYDLSNMGKVKDIFPKQLQKCQVEYFDFYLFHNVCEANIDGYLNPANGILEYLLEQKRIGKIKHLGFSAHGNLQTMTRFLDAYGKYMEFCQLQINWLDWEFQQARQKVELVASYNIPIWVMEPVRGGTLATMRDDHLERLSQFRPNVSAVEWAFRFLQSIPQVVVTLSGMSNFEQLKQNVQIHQTFEPLNGQEMATILQMGDELVNKYTLPCTSCKYCTSHCPMQLNIPWLINLYNEHSYSGGGFIAPMALSALPADKLPSACIGCRSCEAVCPQNIKISEMMTDFVKKIKK